MSQPQRSMPAVPVCPISGSPHVEPFFEVSEVPVHVGLQWPSKETARSCPKGDMRLLFCPESGHIFNAAFDSRLMDYEGVYDNSLDHSPRFQAFITDVATRLIDRYDVRRKRIVEIGCGKGDFLRLICRLGDNQGIGFDPSYEEDGRDGEGAERTQFVRGFYSEASAPPADSLCCRHTFEHIPDAYDFLCMVRRSIGEKQDTVVYFEVPSTAAILRDLAVWNIIYEHCSYFSLGSLAYVFARCGFTVCDVYECYEGQFIGIEAVPGASAPDAPQTPWDDAEVMQGYVCDFQENFRRMTQTWEGHLSRIQKAGQRAVLWGAGAKALSFLNMLKIRDQVDYVVDINPSKHGTYIAGTGQQIVSPAFLTTYRPDVVIIMNPIYEHEIRKTLHELGLDVEFLLAS